MDNRLEDISRRVTTKYREVQGDPFNAAMDDLDYLLSVRFNAGLEAAAKVAETEINIETDYKQPALARAIATAIRALSVSVK